MAEIFEPQSEGPEGYVQCEVTGAWLPEDETIEIQGQRVGAEGKQILLERLRSGEGSGEQEKPTVLRRFGCLFLDGLIIGLVVALFSGLAGAVAAVMSSDLDDAASTRMSMMFSQAASLVTSVLVLLYYTYFHGIKGQTPGKMAGKLFVVNPDGSPIGVKKAFWRAIFYNGPSMILSVALLLTLVTLPLSTFLVVTGIGSLVVGVYAIVDIAMALIDTRYQRSLHDLLAKTRVVHVDNE